MEYIGAKDADKIWATVHWQDRADGKHRSEGGTIVSKAPYNDFHIYAAEWYPERLDFFFDDQCYFSFDTDKAGEGLENPFRMPHHIILNLALGGWAGKLDDAALPAQFLVDYVRVYALKQGSR